MTWLNDLLDKYGRLQLWREAVQTSDLQKSLEFSRQAAAAGMEKFAGLKTQPAANDDMVNLGTITVQPTSPPPPSQLGKLLVGAGLLTTGIGVPIGGWLIADALRDIPAPAPAVAEPPPQPEFTDTDTQYDLRLGKDE